MKRGDTVSIFAIADLHLSLATDKPMDVFKGWDNYVERLTENWKKIITDCDTVVLAGDLSWALKLEETAADFAYINSLPGKKLILKGNHDLWWSTVSKMKKFFDANGFDTIDIIHNNAFEVDGFSLCGSRGWFFDEGEENAKILAREAGRLDTSIRAAKATGGEPIVFLHYPPVFAGRVCTEIFDVIKNHDIKRVYYGHIHGIAARTAVDEIFEGVELKLISCDRLSFVPLLIEKT